MLPNVMVSTHYQKYSNYYILGTVLLAAISPLFYGIGVILLKGLAYPNICVLRECVVGMQNSPYTKLN